LIPLLALVFTLQLPPEAAPAAPSPVPAPAPAGLGEAAPPRRIDDLSRPLTGQVPQGSYEAGVRGAFSRNQSLQGPLDGTWLLKDAAGTTLYRVQLVDPGFASGRLEGAWQDLRAGSPMDNSGFFSGVAREGMRLILQFARAGTGLTVLTLDQRPDGAFAGEIRASVTGQADQVSSVVLARP
jgi:hypothetical protein